MRSKNIRLSRRDKMARNLKWFICSLGSVDGNRDSPSKGVSTGHRAAWRHLQLYTTVGLLLDSMTSFSSSILDLNELNGDQTTL